VGWWVEQLGGQTKSLRYEMVCTKENVKALKSREPGKAARNRFRKEGRGFIHETSNWKMGKG